AADDHQAHDADESLRHAEGSACAFGNIHQNSAHPGRQHRRARETNDGEWHAPAIAVKPAAQCFRRADGSTTQSNSSCRWTANSVTCDFRVTPISRPDE